MTALPQKVVPFPETLSASLFFRRLMELLPDHVYFKDRDGKFLSISRAQAEFFGLGSPDDAVGKSDYDFFAHELAVQKDADERKIVETGIGFVGKEERSDFCGTVRWTLSTKLPLIGEGGKIVGTFGISRNITETKLAREALEEQHRLLKTLIEILPCRIFVKDSLGRLEISNEAYRKALGVSDPQMMKGKRVDELIDDDRTSSMVSDDRRVLTEGVSILNREEYDASPLGDKRWSLLSKVPLLDKEGRVQGIVGMSADITLQKEAEARALRTQHELEARTREMESELLLAREMQTELMSASVQNVRDILDMNALFAPQIVFAYEPCAHLAGDFFQAIPLSRHKFGLLVCDVMGHGVKAALVTTLMRGLLTEVTAFDRSPAQVLSLLNNRLCTLLDRPTFPRFVTALYMTVDTLSGHIVVANAGHPWPLWMDEESPPTPISLDESGPALGLIPDATYLPEERLLVPGTRILLYTDGLKEEQNIDGEEFGPERLAQSMLDNSKLVPARSLTAILGSVRSFSGSAQSGDDLCAVMASF